MSGRVVRDAGGDGVAALVRVPVYVDSLVHLETKKGDDGGESRVGSNCFGETG